MGEIYGRATTHTGLSALIGTRCYPGRWPGNLVTPAIRVKRVVTITDDYADHDMPSDRQIAQFQLDILAKTTDVAASVARQCMSAFSGWQSENIGSCRAIDRRDDFDSGKKLARELVTIRVDYKS